MDNVYKIFLILFLAEIAFLLINHFDQPKKEIKDNSEKQVSESISKREETPMKKEKTREEVQIELEELAKEAEPEVLNKADGLMKEFNDEYEKDSKGFKFKCSLWGSFLRISVARMGNPYPALNKNTFMDSIQDYSTALNLNNIKEVYLIEGNKPDREGTVSYYVRYYTTDPGIVPSYPAVPCCRKLYHRNDIMSGNPQNYSYGTGMSSYQIDLIKFKTKNYPRPAHDDQIVFEGASFILYTPAGMGKEVYEKILLATKIKKIQR